MMKIKSKKDFLLLNKENLLRDIVATEIEIELFSSLDENTIVGKQIEGHKSEELTAKEALKIKNQNMEVFSQRLAAIERLLKSYRWL